MHIEELAVQLIIIVGVALFVATILSYFKVPTIVGFIISGLFLGNFGIAESFPGIVEINEIGLALLMFTVGLEFSANKIRYLSRSLIGLGLGMITSVMVLITLVCWLSGQWDWKLSLMIGMIASLSSSAIVLKLLQKNRELETPHGNASVGILLAQDIVFAPMIVAIPFIFGDFSSNGEMLSYSNLSILAQFLGFCVGLGLFTRYLLNPLFLWVLKTRSHELFFFLLFFLFSLIAFGAHHFIGSFSLGAFIAGLCFANFPLAKQALSDILPLRDTFLGLLFTSVGMLVDLTFFITHLHWILLGVVILLVVKPLTIYTLGRFQNYSHTVSLVAGLMTFQVGEFSIVLIKELDKREYFSTGDMQYFLSLTVLTMALTPFVNRMTPWLVERLGFLEKLPLWPRRDQNASGDDTADLRAHSLTGHSIIIGYGVAGKKLGEAFAQLEIPFVVVEMNYNTVMKAQKEELPVMFGDAQRQEILHSAGIDHARSIIITVPSVAMAYNIMVAVRQQRDDVPVIIRVEYERGKSSFRGMNELTLVVSEHESSLRLVSQALSLHGLDRNVILEHFKNLRQLWSEQGEDPWVDFLPYVHPGDVKYLTLEKNSYAVSLTLKSLHIKEHTGAWILAIQKSSAPDAFVPRPEYVLDPGDTLLIYVSAEDYKRVHLYLEQGPNALAQELQSAENKPR